MSDTFGMPTLLVDIDPEQALRVEQELYAQRRRQLQEISQEIDGICRSAWYEFYAREPFQCAQLLGSLEVATPQPPSSSDDLLEDAEPIDADVSPNAAAFQLWSASLARPSVSSVKAGPSLPTLCPYAYPKYESCTPSIEIARYTADQRIVRFVPYADELGLDSIEKYCNAHMEVGWQTEWFDIDFKLIAADTLLRLEALELNHDKINQLKPEFIPLLGTGYIASLRKRDILGWGSEALQNAQATSVPTTPNILAEVNSLVAHFCSSLNCNKARCMFHDIISPPVILDPPAITKVEMYESRQDKRRCGEDCFLCYALADYETELSMDENICDIIKLFMEELPCKLALLARTTCYNVFHHQCSLFSHGWKGDNSMATTGQGLDYCIHTGMCTQNNCYCVQNGLKCHRRCKCPKQCKERIMCKCGKHGNNPPCQCKSDEAECDPELCKKQRKRGKPSQKQRPKSSNMQKHRCSNMQYQLNEVQHLAVKIGTWGLGTFAVSKIPAGSFLGEYISERMYVFDGDDGGNKLVDAQEMVHNLRGLNYSFTLDETHFLDAATIGDMLRYINDPREEEKANVTAVSRIVAGQTKILFHSIKTIKAGQELMLFYGKEYWNKGQVTDTEHILQ